MTQAIVLAGFEPEPELPPVTDSEERRSYRLTVPLFLAAGWGALIAFSTMFLMDEAKVGRASATTERVALAESAAFETASEVLRPIGANPPAPRWDEPEVPAPTPAKAKPAVAAKTVSLTPVPVEAPVPPSRPEKAVVERADYTGTWGPTASACGMKSRRRGYLPAVITEDGAQAGRTQCRFRNGHRDGVAWTTTADCSDRGRRWTSQVRLIVDGDRLTWTSGKGPAFYIRCGRRDG